MRDSCRHRHGRKQGGWCTCQRARVLVGAQGRGAPYGRSVGRRQPGSATCAASQGPGPGPAGAPGTTQTRNIGSRMRVHIHACGGSSSMHAIWQFNVCTCHPPPTHACMPSTHIVVAPAGLRAWQGMPEAVALALRVKVFLQRRVALRQPVLHQRKALRGWACTQQPQAGPLRMRAYAHAGATIGSDRMSIPPQSHRPARHRGQSVAGQMHDMAVGRRGKG